VLFNAGYNKQVFSLKSLFSKKNAKTHTLIPKNDVTEPKARLLEKAVKLLTS